MDSTRSNNRSRAEINHSNDKQFHNFNHNQQQQHQPQRPMVPLKLNIESHSEPIPHSRAPMTIFTENTENIPPPSTMFKMPMSDYMNQHHKISHDRLDESNHRQFSFEMDQFEDPRLHEHDDNDLSEPEPSPTPIVSDLDDLLIDTPNRYNIENHRQDTDDDPSHDIDINIDQYPSFPVHGISIPYNLEDDDSDTPEPLDTPQTPGGYEANYNYNLVSSSEMVIKMGSDYDHDAEHEADGEEEDVVISDDAFISEDLPPIKPKLRLSTSWKEKTMTRRDYRRSQRITCITPISQEMAVLKIRNYYTRRHSVANITPSVHQLFKLDPDLMKIREEYLEKQKSKKSVLNHDDIKESDQETDDDEPLFVVQSDNDEEEQLNESQKDEADDVDLINDINVMTQNRMDL